MAYKKRRVTRNAAFDIKAYNALTPAQKKKYKAARARGMTAAQALAFAKRGPTSKRQAAARTRARGDRRKTAKRASTKKKSTKKKATKKKSTKKKTTKKKTTKKKTTKRRTKKKTTTRRAKKKTTTRRTSRESCFTKAEIDQIRALTRKLEELRRAAACRLGQQRARKAGQRVKRGKCKTPPRSVKKSAQVMGYARARKAGEKIPSARQMANRFLKED